MSHPVIGSIEIPRGELRGATHVGTSGEPGEGSYVRFWLLVRDGIIADASFATPGCPSSVTAASMTARLIRGRTIENALKLEAEDLLLVLGGLPDGRGHFAAMCVEALRDALKEKS